jgi:glycosyltransferase involved in cell wall biosynthesis
MPRVLIDGTIYGIQAYGGINRTFIELLPRLADRLKNVVFWLHLPSRVDGPVPSGPGIKTIRDLRFTPNPPLVVQQFSRGLSVPLLRMMRPRLFHSTYYTLPYSQKWKTVVTVHDFINENHNSLMQYEFPGFIELKRRSIENADAIVAVSEATKQDILEHTNVEEARIEVVHHGASEAFYSSRPSLEEMEKFRISLGIDRPYWLYVGQRAGYKNFGTLLQAWTLLSKTTDEETYLVAIGPFEALEAWQMDLLIKNNLHNRLKILSNVDDRTVHLAFCGTTALVFPSLAEGFGLPLLEAMACGTPVVASDIPVFHEVAGDAAYYFDPHSVDMLVEAMLKIQDPDIIRELVSKGHKHAQMFSWEKAATKITEIYRRLI